MLVSHRYMEESEWRESVRVSPQTDSKSKYTGMYTHVQNVQDLSEVVGKVEKAEFL